jgi:cystathionine beta-lyase/cystathionine gamma-synthase
VSDGKTITLGGREFPIAPLTLGQMRTVGPAFTRIGVDTPEGMAAQYTVIAAAMKNGDLAIESAAAAMLLVDSIVGVTFGELRAAIETIGEMIGVKTKVVVPGEAAAPAAAPEPPLAS